MLRRKLKTLFNLIFQYFKFFYWSKKEAKKQIQKNKIILWSFRGKAYSCNPKYVTEYILRTCQDAFELVWAFDDPDSFRFLERKRIKLVKFYSKEFFSELMTSKFVITNTRIGIDFHKRKGQVYIQTWHGILALKKIEKDAWKHLKFSYVLNAYFDSKNIDYLLSGCTANTLILKKAFWYNGPILEIGNPRNDIFFDKENTRKKIDDRYGTINKKIVMYAPTFRKNNSLDVYDINYERILNSLNLKFKKEFVFFVRLHPNIKHLKINNLAQNVHDVSDYDDMQELLCASDLLITDFSSSMFDFVIMRKICFLFALDYKEYISEERGTYFDVKADMPFPFATSNDELVSLIDKLNLDDYNRRLESFFYKLGANESGDASKKLINLMKDLIERNA